MRLLRGYIEYQLTERRDATSARRRLTFATSHLALAFLRDLRQERDLLAILRTALHRAEPHRHVSRADLPELLRLAGHMLVTGQLQVIAVDHTPLSRAMWEPAAEVESRGKPLIAKARNNPANTAAKKQKNSDSTWEEKKGRLKERQNFIRNGSSSPDPKVRNAAERLARNNEAVELARLSDDAYDQYPPIPGHAPPTGWTAMTKEEVGAAGIDPELLKDSQAVIYKSRPDWPGGQQTILSFRGTNDNEDILVDHDQAFGLPTRQYEAATLLGTQVKEQLGSNVIVTGHSLGGGKAQAAGAAGDLKGVMFNSAGLNPESCGGAMPDHSQFQQFRTPNDPLTGIQNSAVLQTAAAVIAGDIAMPLGSIIKVADAGMRLIGGHGLSPDIVDYADKAVMALPRGLKNLFSNGSILPPAVGDVYEVPAIADGRPVSAFDIKKQHSIKSVINGIEQQKSEDISLLR